MSRNLITLLSIKTDHGFGLIGMARIQIGEEEINLEATKIIEPKLTSLRFDADTMQPCFIPREKFIEICEALNLPQLAVAPAESGKKFHDWLRSVGQPLMSVFYAIVTNPNFSTEGVLVSFNAEETEEDQEDPDQDA